MVRSALFVVLASSAVSLAGCGGGPGQTPSAAFTGGGDCKATKAELNRLVVQGVANDVDAQASGRKLSLAAQARVDRYNDLLNAYLGAQCHV
jgi:hypothetical protein